MEEKRKKKDGSYNMTTEHSREKKMFHKFSIPSF